MVRAAWYPDPTGRHEGRYWDGTKWTDTVHDGGSQSTDPIMPSPPTPEQEAEVLAKEREAAEKAAAERAEAERVAAEQAAQERAAAEAAARQQAEQQAQQQAAAQSAQAAQVTAPGATPATTPAATPAAPSVPAGWYPDPAGRHEGRWWDGTQWSPTVHDRGVQATDPL